MLYCSFDELANPVIAEHREEISFKTMGAIIRYSSFFQDISVFNQLFNGIIFPDNFKVPNNYIFPKNLEDKINEQSKKGHSYYIEDPNNWAKLIEERKLFFNLVQASGDPLTPLEVGRYAQSSEGFKAASAMFILLSQNPNTAFKFGAEKINARLNRVFSMTHERGGHNHSVMNITYFDQYKPHILGDLYTLGVLIAGIERILPESTVTIRQLISPFDKSTEEVKLGLNSRGVNYFLDQCEFRPNTQTHLYHLEWEPKKTFFLLKPFIVPLRRLSMIFKEYSRQNWASRLTPREKNMIDTAYLIGEQTEELEEERARSTKLEGDKYHLVSRQDHLANYIAKTLIVNLFGTTHRKRNLNSKINEVETTRIITSIASTIWSTYSLLDRLVDTQGKEYLGKICKPFGLTESDLGNIVTIEDKLYNVRITREEAEQKIELPPNLPPEIAEQVRAKMPKQIFIGDAYETFKQIRQDHLEDLQKNPADIDPFKLFFSLKQINSLVSQQDEMTAQITDLVSQLFVSVKLSDVVEKAVEEAHELATTLGKEFSVEIDLKYDPLFVTNFVSLKTKIRDELYNVVKHGGEKARVYCDLTNQIPSYILDFHNRDLQLTEPIPRLIIEDNGAGIADTPMQHMNEYLAGRRNKVTSTSGGGLGTEIMRHFLGIHDTICYCERIEEPGKTGTRYSSYFLKTRA